MLKKFLVALSLCSALFSPVASALAEEAVASAPAVTATVCSKCADNRWSRVTAVHPSASTRTEALPAFTIGSMAIVMPGFNRAELFPGSTKFGTCGSSCTSLIRSTGAKGTSNSVKRFSQ